MYLIHVIFPVVHGLISADGPLTRNPRNGCPVITQGELVLPPCFLDSMLQVGCGKRNPSFGLPAGVAP